MPATFANVFRAGAGALLLLVTEAVTAGHVHLELQKSITTRSELGRRDYVSSDIGHTPNTPWYYVEVLLGNPPQEVKLRLEDGGATWLPWLSKIDDIGRCESQYPTSTYGDMCKYARISGLYNPLLSDSFVNITTGLELMVDYPASQTKGIFGTESLQLNQLMLSNFTMGLANSFQTSPALGVGVPQDTTAYPYESFLQHLKSQGLINSLIYSIYLNDMYAPGDVYFGAIDETRFYGSLKKFDNVGTGFESHIPISGVWWDFMNTTTKSLVKANRDESEYGATASLHFGNNTIGFPQDIYDRVKAKFEVEETDGQLRVKCDANIMTGNLNFGIAARIYNITSRDLLSNEIQDGDQCYRTLQIEVVPPIDDRTPAFRLGDPFLRGTYAVFDYTNKQTLIAPAFVNASGSNVVEVGANNAGVEGSGHKLTNYHTRLPTIVNPEDLNAPGTPSQPGSDPSESKGIIIGGILGGIVALVLILGAVYAIRPRSERSRDMATWFAFTRRSRNSTPEPEIAYPPPHNTRHYQTGSSRITPVSYGPPQRDDMDPDAIHSNGGIHMREVSVSENGEPSTSYYVNSAFRNTRALSNVEEAVEMAAAPVSSSSSSSRYPQHHDEIQRYG
ncbi:Barrierpepsin [Orbilia brochopaga]|nr:Barrierpepsin [Drechslerella brochopaga]